MYFNRKNQKYLLKVYLLLLVVMAFTSCHKKKNLHFNNPQEAISVCRQELFEVKSKQTTKN
jgi:hypothetical protein